MADDEDRDAFGYHEDPLVFDEAVSVQVAEGKAPGTLEPLVVIYFRIDLDGPHAGIAVSPDLADGLAAELTRMAARAREKHWE